eukprot:2959155-Prymnesium_polylepis.1
MSKAGARWSTEEHDTLLRLHSRGEPIEHIAARLQRTEGAIESRLRHLADGTVPPVRAAPAPSTVSPRRTTSA